MKNLVYLSLLSILILPFFVSDASAVLFGTPFEIISVSPNEVSFSDRGVAKDDLGNIYVIYIENNEPDPESLYIVKTDSLGNFTAPVVIDTVVAGFGYNYRDWQIFVNGTTVDVFYNKDVGLTDRNYSHKRSMDSGATWSSEHAISSGDIFQLHQIVVDGDNFYFTAYFPFDVNSQPDGDDEIYFIKSTDAGVNWSTKIVISDVTDVNILYEFFNRIIPDGSDIYISFKGQEQSGFFDRVFFTKSTDSGATWSTPVDLGAGIEEHFLNIYADMFQNPLDSDELIIIFNDVTTNIDHVSVKSTDGGTSWGTLQTIAPESECDYGEEFVDEKLFSVDGTETLYWFCIDDGDKIAFKKSIDFGDTWSTLQLILTPNSGNSLQGLIDVEIVGNSIFITYEQEIGVSGIIDLYYHESLDNGDNFSTAQSIFNDTDIGNYSYVVDENLNHFFVFNDNILSPDDDEILVMIAEGIIQNGIPVLTLVGSNPQQVNQFSSYVESGASCIDPEEGNISGSVVISGTVNTSVIGSYTKFYDCQDSSGGDAIQISRTVNVVDAEAPIITLIGDNPMSILVGSTYIEPSATCNDANDGDITGNLIISGDTVVTTSTGSFDVEYDCQDSNSNNALTVIRKVNVVLQTTGSSGSGGASVPTVPSQGAGSQPTVDDLTDEQISELLKQLEPAKEKTIIQEIVQTFFEFQVLDKTHSNLQVQSFLANEQLGIRWSTGDDIIIASVVPASSPFDFTFEQLPVIKDGSGSAISENGISYNLQVPTDECDVAFGFDCVEKIRYSIPVTVNAIINGTEVDATGTILVDLTEEELNPILVILFGLLSIPVVAGVVWATRGGHNPSKVKDLLR